MKLCSSDNHYTTAPQNIGTYEFLTGKDVLLEDLFEKAATIKRFE